jgi:flavin reductase (DIM6/NTAB) family NADH-FMN oxidoreductase RutF
VSTVAPARADCTDELPGLSPEGFAEAFGNLATGATFVTAGSPRDPVVIAGGQVMQVSTAPPLFAVSACRGRPAEERMLRARSVVLHLLGADQVDLARSAGEDPRGAALDWGSLHTGEPFVFGAAVWIRGQVIDRLETGDSALLVVHATHACYPPIGMTQAATWPGPLVRHRDDWHALARPSDSP